MTVDAAALGRIASHEFVVRLERALAAHPATEATESASGTAVASHGKATRPAAILLMLRAREDGEPELLMIQRAELEGDPWSGHIACPGGRMEPSDADLRATAVRETWEETGIDVARDGRIIGQLDDLRPLTPSLPAIVIRPFVAIVRSDVAIVTSAEVAKVFWVPLSALAATGAWTMGTVVVRGVARRVNVFQHGAFTVWGLTERALKQLMQRAAPSS